MFVLYLYMYICYIRFLGFAFNGSPEKSNLRYQLKGDVVFKHTYGILQVETPSIHLIQGDADAAMPVRSHLTTVDVFQASLVDFSCRPTIRTVNILDVDGPKIAIFLRNRLAKYNVDAQRYSSKHLRKQSHTSLVCDDLVGSNQIAELNEVQVRHQVRDQPPPYKKRSRGTAPNKGCCVLVLPLFRIDDAISTNLKTKRVTLKSEGARPLRNCAVVEEHVDAVLELTRSVDE